MQIYINYQFHDQFLKPVTKEIKEYNEETKSEITKVVPFTLKEVLANLVFMTTKKSENNPRLAYSLGIKLETTKEDYLDLSREERNYLADLIEQQIQVNTSQGPVTIDREPLVIAQAQLVLDGENPWDKINQT